MIIALGFIPEMGTILLVDDDRLYRWALRVNLEKAGHHVLEAESCAQALKSMGPTVDLALLDYKLPDGTGVMILRQIKEQYPSCPVLILTAFPNEESAVEARRHQVHRYLEKPTDTAQVLPLVTEVLVR